MREVHQRQRLRRKVRTRLLDQRPLRYLHGKLVLQRHSCDVRHGHQSMRGLYQAERLFRCVPNLLRQRVRCGEEPRRPHGLRWYVRRHRRMQEQAGTDLQDLR
jgi:hypothetical protein